MKQLFYLIQLIVVLSFTVWLVFRNKIWSDFSLFPSEMVAIYTRDGASYFLLLRATFLASGIAGAIFYWKNKKIFFLLFPIIWYSLLMGIDNICLIMALQKISLFNENLVPTIAWMNFRALIEAISTLFLGGIGVWYFHTQVKYFSEFTNEGGFQYSILNSKK